MENFIIDVNFPYYFQLWKSDLYTHQIDINAKASDQEIWDYAREHDLTIITKDSDFSNRILISKPPPKIIHIRFGNMKMNEFYQLINNIWDDVLIMVRDNKLVNVYKDRIEGIN